MDVELSKYAGIRGCIREFGIAEYVKITPDKTKPTITIEDSGTGKKDELINIPGKIIPDKTKPTITIEDPGTGKKNELINMPGEIIPDKTKPTITIEDPGIGKKDELTKDRAPRWGSAAERAGPGKRRKPKRRAEGTVKLPMDAVFDEVGKHSGWVEESAVGAALGVEHNLVSLLLDDWVKLGVMWRSEGRVRMRIEAG